MKIISIYVISLFTIFNPATAATEMRTDQIHVNKWNNFVSELHQLQLDLTRQSPVFTTETTGGYGGEHANSKFYREVSYFNKNTDKLLSRIQWEIKNPDTIHAIEVYLYDEKKRVKTDYYARFLPESHNAPVQTLINLHNYNDNLHSFRQFDANGELIYEMCSGKFYNEDINLNLSDEEIYQFRNNNTNELENEAYTECFNHTPATAEAYLSPVVFINHYSPVASDLSAEQQLKVINEKILQLPEQAKLYLERGELLFNLHHFEKSIADYNKALSLDNSLYQAYFGRGMALARDGQVDAGIKDLSTYIQHDPLNSRAYTKRGVRYIWAGKLKLAKQDLIKAIALNNKNSEAHDDLGVLYAQEKNYDNALKHFSLAVQHDPSYQKAYHNQAIIYTSKQDLPRALIAINKSLELNSNSRNSLILKSEILNAMGKVKEAEAIIKKAEFLPEGNWSERFPVQ